MRIQLSLNHPGYLSRNGIFNFPQDADDFDITVVADVLDEHVDGVAADHELAVDVLGYTPVVSRDNNIWVVEEEEPADVDSELRIRITDVIVDEITAEGTNDDDDDVGEADEEREGLTFIANEEEKDADDYDENDELLARAAAEDRDAIQKQVDQRRFSIEVDLQSQLVGQELILEFTAGILVNWSRA